MVWSRQATIQQSEFFEKSLETSSRHHHQRRWGRAEVLICVRHPAWRKCRLTRLQNLSLAIDLYRDLTFQDGTDEPANRKSIAKDNYSGVIHTIPKRPHTTILAGRRSNQTELCSRIIKDRLIPSGSLRRPLVPRRTLRPCVRKRWKQNGESYRTELKTARRGVNPAVSITALRNLRLVETRCSGHFLVSSGARSAFFFLCH